MVRNMKRETITKSSGPTAEQMAAALEAAPDYVDDPESPYDPNDALAVEAYWAKARLVMPGQHRFQQHQKQHAMTDKTIADKMYVKNASAIAVLNADARHAALVAQLPPPLMVGDGQPADLVLLFAHSQQELEALLPQAKARRWTKARCGSPTSRVRPGTRPRSTATPSASTPKRWASTAWPSSRWTTAGRRCA